METQFLLTKDIPTSETKIGTQPLLAKNTPTSENQNGNLAFHI